MPHPFGGWPRCHIGPPTKLGAPGPDFRTWEGTHSPTNPHQEPLREGVSSPPWRRDLFVTSKPVTCTFSPSVVTTASPISPHRKPGTYLNPHWSVSGKSTNSSSRVMWSCPSLSLIHISEPTRPY